MSSPQPAPCLRQRIYIPHRAESHFLQGCRTSHWVFPGVTRHLFASPITRVPSTDVFPCAWVPCLTSMKCLHADRSDRLPQQPSLCLSSSPLVCSGPLMGRASQRKAFAAHKHHGLDQGDLQSLALMMEGICSPLIPASSPFCGCVPKRAG